MFCEHCGDGPVCCVCGRGLGLLYTEDEMLEMEELAEQEADRLAEMELVDEV